MALKRKRSSPAFSSPFSDSTSDATSYSPLPFFYPHSKPVEPLYHKPTWSFPTYDSTPADAHLNSRTRKRHRDDRPDEEAVYATTITKLYEAQRQHPRAEPVLSHPHVLNHSSPQQPPQPHPPSQRSTLHSFWHIPQPPTSTPMALDAGGDGAAIETGWKCEDCDRPLHHDDAMDVDEQTLEQETRCETCQRHVCDTCSILRDARTCLSCASRTFR